MDVDRGVGGGGGGIGRVGLGLFLARCPGVVHALVSCLPCTVLGFPERWLIAHIHIGELAWCFGNAK